MNGCQFVERVLGHTNYDVGPLIELAAGSENEWLEFKAATSPSHGQFFRNENKWDYRWNVSKSLFGMANHIGGAVLLGVGEVPNSPGALETVSLEDSGFRGDKDEFMRNIIERHLINPQSGWPTGTAGTWACSTQHHLFRPVWGHLHNQPVAIILVKPRAKEELWITLDHLENNISRKVVLARAQGDLGRTGEIPPNTLDVWWKGRDVYRSDLDERFHSFLDRWTSDRKHPEEVTTKTIYQYLEGFLSRHRRLKSIFTPLDATFSSHTGYYEPEAVSFLGPDGQRANRSRLEASNVSTGVQQLLEQYPRAVLLGEPGAGKSTCLRFRAAAMAADWQSGKPWALLVELHEFGDLGLRTLILKRLPGLYWIDIEARISSGEITLMFDALNECPASRYEDCCQEIFSLKEHYPSARILISTRLSHNPTQFDFPSFEIRPMNREQRLKFLELYLGRTDRAAELLERLSRQPGAEYFAGSPVLLSMVATVVCDGKNIPKGLANLYHLFLENWHQRESDKSKRTGAPMLWSFNRILEALALLSYEMRLAGKVSCTIQFARRTMLPVLGAEHVGGFIDRIAQGLLLSKDDRDEVMQFSHETIQEYLAAEYLATQPNELQGKFLPGESMEDSRNWVMPLVFAFELIDRPPREFLHYAWRTEPLLVAAALRDDRQLSSLPIHLHENPWLRGVLRAMRGEDAEPEMRELAYISRLPPKYPLPSNLLSTLHGTAFWYAAGSHAAGIERIERLRNLVLDRNSLFIELMPHLCATQPRWVAGHSTYQRMLIGEPDHQSKECSVANATIVELCTLLRLKKISGSQFNAAWRDALERSAPEHVSTDLIALLRTDAKLTSRAYSVDLTRLPSEYCERLREIGDNWSLSLRLLNVLLRQGFVAKDHVRNEPGRIENIVERMSSTNMYRFMKNGLLGSDDIPALRLAELVKDLRPKLRRELVESGLLTGEEARSGLSKSYCVSDLQLAETRKQINVRLALKEWDVTVERVKPLLNCGFASHSEFADNVIFFLNDIENPNSKPIHEGDLLRVRIGTRFDNKKKRWSFAVKSGFIFRKGAAR